MKSALEEAGVDLAIIETIAFAWSAEHMPPHRRFNRVDRFIAWLIEPERKISDLGREFKVSPTLVTQSIARILRLCGVPGVTLYRTTAREVADIRDNPRPFGTKHLRRLLGAAVLRWQRPQVVRPESPVLHLAAIVLRSQAALLKATILASPAPKLIEVAVWLESLMKPSA